jgi:hypothetical protein
MTPTAGQRISSSFSFSQPRPSAPTTMAPTPATLQPDPSLTFTVPYFPARILLSPPPYRSFFFHTVSTSSSPAISPTTIPTITRPRHCPLATPFLPETSPPTTSTVTPNPPELYERPGRCSKCVCHPQHFPEANASIPWGLVAWTTSNRAEKAKSLACSADTYASCTSGGPINSKDQLNAPSRPSREIFLEQWLREQARFHACDDFVNQTDYVPFEEPLGGGFPGPRQTPSSEATGRRSSEASMEWKRSDG